MVALSGLAADQLAKHQVLAHLAPGEGRPLFGTFLQLRLVFNSGAAFSLGSGATPLFTVLSAIVLGFVLSYLMPRVRVWYWGITFGLLAAGVAGNLTDRLARPPGFGRGHVVDFLQLPHWPIFNIADMCIVAAAILTICLSTWGNRGWRGQLASGAAGAEPKRPEGAGDLQ